MIPTLLLSALAGLASALGSFADLCITEPPLLLVAGETTIQATNHDPTRTDCRAAIYFADPAFAPINYPYGAGACLSGAENASFLVPPDVPSGDAFVTWSCGTHTQACLRAVIFKGRGNPELPPLVDGTVECHSIQDCDEAATNREQSNIRESPVTSPTRAATQGSTQFVVTPTGGEVSNQSPIIASETTRRPTMTAPEAPKVTNSGSSPAQREPQKDSTSSASTEGKGSDGGFANISTATRVTPPSLARSLLTVTRTVTTLIKTTMTGT